MEIFAGKHELARAAAKQTVNILESAIKEHGNATWVLAGGSTPMEAYRIIADAYLEAIDWSLVTFLIGDERIGSDYNLPEIETLFLNKLADVSVVRPNYEVSAGDAAEDYEKKIEQIERFDMVWLGMGQDGHTLSLFPHQPSLLVADRLVIPVYNSPKPPSQRISLTFEALKKATHTFILASGADKKAAFVLSQEKDSDLPVAKAARITNARWLIDESLASTVVQ